MPTRARRGIDEVGEPVRARMREWWISDANTTAGNVMTELNDSIAHSLDRRRMLQVVGAAGAAGVLAACGGGTSDSGDSATPDDTTPDDSANDQDTGSEEPDGSDEPSDEGEGGDNGEADAIAATGDVPVGGGVIAGGVVVTQPAEGDFRAFSSTCTHQGCTVADVSDGIISCPCHSSQYSAEDGSVERGPATEALPEVDITVDGDQIIRS